MFTGIIQAVGTVVGVETTPRRHAGGALAHRLEIDLGALAEGLQHGASVAVSGPCLTLAELRGTVGGFDVVPETWQRTTLNRLRRGDPVNLERSLRVGDPVDGHFVQGHVDGPGVVDRIERTAGEWKLWVRTEPALRPYLVRKGSIALDGTSLTIVDFARPQAQGARFFSLAAKDGDTLPLKTELTWWSVLERRAYACAFIHDGRTYDNPSHNITTEALLPQNEPLALGLG